MISNLVHQWTTKINAKLPSLWTEPASDMQRSMEEHFQRVINIIENHESALSPYLKDTKGPVLGVRDIIDSKVKMAIGTFQKNSDSLTIAIESIRESMDSTFTRCKDITGELRSYWHVCMHLTYSRSRLVP